VPERIKQGQWPYTHGKAVPYSPTPHAPPWSILAPQLQGLFLRAFDEGHARPDRRPGAGEWQQALANAEAELIPCSANAQHHYSRTLKACPWCALARQHGRDPFPSPQAVTAGTQAALPPALPVGRLASRSTQPRRTRTAQTATLPAPRPSLAGYIRAVMFWSVFASFLIATGVAIWASWEVKHDNQQVSDENLPWVQLFNGKDLTGWKTRPEQPGNWHVENGAIVSGGDRSHLFSERSDFENFHLRVEAMINADGNSGVYFRSEYGLSRLAADKKAAFPAGYQAQIYLGSEKNAPRTGSLSQVVGVFEQLVKPDTWFTMEIIAQGKHIVIKIDGKTTVDFLDEQHPYKKGCFALQQNGAKTVAHFRKIEIKELPAGK
jgi:hypothetical protein